MDLQWPHQGARNLTNTDLPEVSASQVSGVSSIALAAVAARSTRREEQDRVGATIMQGPLGEGG